MSPTHGPLVGCDRHVRDSHDDANYSHAPVIGECVLSRRKPKILPLAAVTVAAAAALLPMTAASAATISSPRGPVANVLRPSAVTPAGIPIFDVGSGSFGLLPDIHACAALGNDGTTQGVECADIYVNGVSGQVDISPASEAACQNLANPSVFPQCANAAIKMALFFADPGTIQATGWDTGTCGPSNPCATPRQYFTGPITSSFPVTSCTEVWTVVNAGSNVKLPGSGRTVSSAANLGSGHAIVCPT